MEGLLSTGPTPSSFISSGSYGDCNGKLVKEEEKIKHFLIDCDIAILRPLYNSIIARISIQKLYQSLNFVTKRSLSGTPNNVEIFILQKVMP